MRGLIALLLMTAVASAAPPRGKRAHRPKATHVTVVDVPLAGGDRPSVLVAGTPVAVKKGKGKTAEIVVADNVELVGSVPAADLGLRVLKEVEARDAAGVAGKIRAGAVVRVAGVRAGTAEVETVGPISARLKVDAAALGTDRVGLVLPDAAGQPLGVIVEDAELFADEKLKTRRARLARGARFVLLEEKGDAARVKGYGAYELEGWVYAAKLGDPGALAVDATPAEAPVVRQPTHEVFLDTPLFLGSDGKKKLGLLRGGTLVSITQKPKDGYARIETVGAIRAEGWVKLADLEELTSSVWRDGP